MPESVESFMARKHVDNWQRKYRSALRGYIPVGTVLPGEKPRVRRRG